MLVQRQVASATLLEAVDRGRQLPAATAAAPVATDRLESNHAPGAAGSKLRSRGGNGLTVTTGRPLPAPRRSETKSGRGRAHARRPPTTPDVRITYPAFPVTWSGIAATASCVSFVVSPVDRLRTPLPPSRLTASTALAAGSPSTVTSVLTDSESTRDCPLMTGSALCSTGAVCHMLCPSDLRGGVPCKYRASHLWACLPTPPRLYPLPVRRTSTLPAASFGSRIAPDTLAVQLPLPLAGCGGDSHPQVIAPPPRGCG